MWLSRLKTLSGFFLAAILSAPAWGANSPQPGTINYFEGHVDIGVSALNSKSIGSAELHRGQSLATKNGKAEVLLTPGVFLRIGNDSSIKMISPNLANTKVRLTKGQAMVEVDEIYKSNDISVLEDGAATRLLKTGLYDFDANQGQVRVFKGQALVSENNRHVKVGGGHEVSLNASGPLKARGFDKKQYESSLYRFSKLRSDYLAEANVNASHVYASSGWYGSGWYGSGWYWDPWLSAYTFAPAGGVLYSPFGFGFYSPFAVGEAPFAFHRRFGDFRDFDNHPNFAIRQGIETHPEDKDFATDRPPIRAFHAPPAQVAPRVGGFARGPVMGEVHPPGGFAFHDDGFHGGEIHGGERFGGGIRR
jgi:hypothetical protein